MSELTEVLTSTSAFNKVFNLNLQLFKSLHHKFIDRHDSELGRL